MCSENLCDVVRAGSQAAFEPGSRREDGAEAGRVAVYRNQSELARGEGVSTAAVSIALKALRDRER